MGLNYRVSLSDWNWFLRKAMFLCKCCCNHILFEITNYDVTNNTKNINTSIGIQQKQHDANAYISANLHIWNRYQQFCKDEQLVEIRLDRELDHETQKMNKNMKQKQVYPKCVMCTAKSGFGSEKASQTGLHCATCNVPLCITPKDGSKYSCHHLFHNLKDTGKLVKKKYSENDEVESKNNNLHPRKKKKNMWCVRYWSE